MTNHLFIHNVQVAGKNVDIAIEGNRIKALATNIPHTEYLPSEYIDGTGYAAFPTFANLHTHAAMTLFRGYGSDVSLQSWLNDWIWPKEKLLNEERVYWGVRLACVEMIKSGTTAFADMYFHLPAAAQAVRESGIRALLGDTMFGDAERCLNGELLNCMSACTTETQTIKQSNNQTILYSIAPHAIYTVSEKGLQRCADACRDLGVPMIIHMSETQREVDDCLREHGCRPWMWLEKVGIIDRMGENIIAAHSLHLSEDEIRLIGDHHITCVHCPNSNLKLGSGYRFPIQELRAAGARVTLGTDGCASSNNLDMLEAAKTMSLLQKGWRNDPTVMPTDETLQVASRNGFAAMGIEAGDLSAGRLADLMLVDLNQVSMVPRSDTAANLLYSAHSDVIDTVICDGRVVMRHRQVEGEAEVMESVCRIAEEMGLTGLAPQRQ